MTVAQARQYLEVIQSLRADQIGPLLSVRHPAPDLTMATELSARLNQAILRPQRPVIPRAARAGAERLCSPHVLTDDITSVRLVVY